MRTSFTRAGMMAVAAVLVSGAVACGADSEPRNVGPADTQAGAGTADGPRTGDGADGQVGRVAVEEQADEPGTTIDAGQGDYEFGLGRDSINETIEATYGSDNASVTWEGDTMVVAMDGDAESPLAAWSECRVITRFVLEDESVAIEYPNGRLECNEVMADG